MTKAKSKQAKGGSNSRSKTMRITNEMKRLIQIFEDIPEDKVSLIEGLIRRAAFMRITLEDYEADINKNGSVESFSQSENQTPYERGRPVVGFYNTMAKNYQAAMKQLTDLLPDNSVAPNVPLFNKPK